MDSLFLHSKTQGEVLENLGNVTNISYLDNSECLQTIFLSILKNLDRDKACIVVAKNEEDRLMIKDLLLKAGLEKFGLFITPENKVTEIDLEYMRHALSSISDYSNDSDVETSEFKYRRFQKEIDIHYKNLLSNTNLELKVKAGLNELISQKPNEQMFLLHDQIEKSQFSFDLEEYKNLRLFLEEALFIYQRDFELSESIETKLGFQSESALLDKMQDITYDLFTIKETAENIRNNFLKCLRKIENEQWLSAGNAVRQYVERLDLIKFKIENFIKIKEEEKKKNNIFKSFIQFDKSKDIFQSELIADFETVRLTLVLNKLITETRVPLSIEKIVEYIENIKVELGEWEKGLRKKISHHLKSSNKLNLKDKRLQDLEVDLKALLDKINGLGFFENKLELNTLSFKKQTELVSKLVYNIEVELLKIEKNISYYRWVSFLNEQDERSIKLVQTLKTFEPQYWLDIFESWYYFEVLSQYFSTTKKLDEKIIFDAELHCVNFEIDKIKNKVHKSVDQNRIALKELKEKDKSLFDALTKKKELNDHWNWKYMLETKGLFLSQCFPILITDNDDLGNLPKDSYTEIVYLDYYNANVEILQNFKTIYSYFKKEDLKEVKIDCALETYKPLHLKPLSDTSTLERLTIVKHLSTNLLSFGKNPTVFQLRNSSIISFSSDFVNEYLEDKLYKFGIKNILLDDSIYETLVATMHDVNRQVIILTEDLLFSLENYESFESQFMVLQQAMKSGCELKNIDSKELFDSLGLILNELVEELEDINFVKTDQKNQILLELN